MKNVLRIAAVAAVALGGLVAAQPSHAQGMVVGGQLMTTLTPRPDIPYIPGHVPSQCLPYTNKGAGVLFCDPDPGSPGSKYDVTLNLYFGGFKPFVFKTPDDCILRHMAGAPGGMGAMFCQLSHKW